MIYTTQFDFSYMAFRAFVLCVCMHVFDIGVVVAKCLKISSMFFGMKATTQDSHFVLEWDWNCP